MISAQILDAALFEPLALRERLGQSGLVFFEDIAEARLAATLSELGSVCAHPDADEQGTTTLQISRGRGAGPVQDGKLGLTPGALFPHTDRSVMDAPPAILAFWCVSPARNGGLSTFVDGRRIYERLRRDRPDAIAILETPGHFLFRYGDTFCSHSVFEPVPGGRRRLRFRRDNFFYATPSAWRHLERLLALIEENTIQLLLGAGQGYVVQNSRWLHGRTRFLGSRTCKRLLVEAGPQAAELDSFAPIADARSETQWQWAGS